MGKLEFTTVVDGKEIALAIIDINNEVRNESNKFYNAALNEALSNKFLLNVEVEKLLETKGLKDADEDLKIDASRKNLKRMEKELRSAVKDGRKMTKSEGKALALAMKAERTKLYAIGRTKNELYSKTAESHADNARLKFFIYACTVYNDSGERYWKSYEDFVSDAANKVYEDATSAFFKFISGVNQDSDKELYENKWLVRMKFMDEKLQLVDDKGRLIDEMGRLINTEGRYINENGDFVDIYGNIVDKEGALVVTDGWSE